MAAKLTELYALNFLLAPINWNHGNHAVSCNDDVLYCFTWCHLIHIYFGLQT